MESLKGSSPTATPFSLHSETATAVHEAIPGEAVEILRREDLEKAAVDDGSMVLGRDGTAIGRIHTLGYDPSGRVLTSIVIQGGDSRTRVFPLPASMIFAVNEGTVYLTINGSDMAD